MKKILYAEKMRTSILYNVVKTRFKMDALIKSYKQKEATAMVWTSLYIYIYAEKRVDASFNAIILD